MPRRPLPYAVVLVAIFAAALIAAQQEPPVVSARVVGPDGVAAISGAVALMTSSSNRVTASIGRDGTFRMTPNADGRHALFISVPGLAPYRANITVPASRSMKLPDLVLTPATYYRLHLLTPEGEELGGRGIRWTTIDSGGAVVPDPLGHTREQTETDGTIMIGPLPIGRTAMAFDRAPLARTRLRDVTVTGAEPLIDGGTFTISRGGRLEVTIVDAAAVPVPGHDVWIEEAAQPSLLTGITVKTSPEGRAQFDRVGPGRYRLWTRTTDRCGYTPLTIARLVQSSGDGVARARIAVSGKAAVRIVSALGPVAARQVTLTPEAPERVPWLPRFADPVLPSRSVPNPRAPSCGGNTDADGRITFSPFPPGPAELTVRLYNSVYLRRITIPESGVETRIEIPDGLIPVKVLDASTRRPVAMAKSVWTASGARVEALTNANGDALLEGTGMSGGVLTISADRYQTLEGSFTELPEATQEVALRQEHPERITITITTDDDRALPGAIVQLQSGRAGDPMEMAMTDARGMVPLFPLPPGALRMTVHADGYVTATALVSGENGGGVGLALKRAR